MIQLLLAEDNPADILLVEEAFKIHQLDYSLKVLRDGAEVLKYIGRMGKDGASCPDLFLMDMNLPKAGGLEILTAFRHQPACADIPVVVVSSSDSPKERARMEAMGITEYFRKPSDFDHFMDLGAVVKRIVSERKRTSESA